MQSNAEFQDLSQRPRKRRVAVRAVIADKDCFMKPQETNMDQCVAVADTILPGQMATQEDFGEGGDAADGTAERTLTS